MTQELTVYAADDMKMFGNVVVASNETVACVMHDDGEDSFAINHEFETPGRAKLYFNEKNERTGEVVTRCFEFDPIKLSHAMSRLVREAKGIKQDSFI